MRSLILAVDPVRKFETPTGVWPLLSIAGSVGVGANTQMLAGITGKRIRVMGWSAVGQVGVGAFMILDGSGGTVIHNRISFPALATGTNEKKEIVDSGYCETTAGTGLFVTVETAAVFLTFYYIAYAP